jgi:hypothetical protein
MLLSPEVVECEENELLALIKTAKEQGKIVVQPDKIRITQKTVKPCQLKPAEYVTYFNNRYLGLKAIIDKKMQSVAINKLAFGNSSIVGMVREHTDIGFVAEDPTGCIEIVSKEKPEPGVVIGINGYVKDGKFLANQIIWPDVPLTHIPNYLPGYKLIVKGRNMQIENKSIDILSNPTWIKISTDHHLINILAYATDNPQPKLWLKQRHLNPALENINSTEDVWLLDPLPDLIWIITNVQFKDCYRGICIFSPGQAEAVINLSDFSINFIEENKKT